MADRFLRCDNCGKMNPDHLRVCMDCGAMLIRPGDTGSASPRGPKSEAATGKPTGFDAIEEFYNKKDPLERTGEVAPLAAVERLDRDESAPGDVLAGIERIGDDRDEEEESDDPFVRSRAFEVEGGNWHDEDPDASVPFNEELETLDEAEARTREQSSEYHRIAKEQAVRPKSGPRIEEPPATVSEFDRRPKTVPKHRTPWERSDVEIMTTIRRKKITADLIGRTLPLIAVGLAIAVAARLFLFPLVLPGGRWGGTMIDRIGNSTRTDFTLDLKRSGDELRGTFWLAHSPGATYQEDAAIAIPYSLQPIYTGRPVPVVGRFNRAGISLTLYGTNTGADAARIDFEGAFESRTFAKGTATNTDRISSLWELTKK